MHEDRWRLAKTKREDLTRSDRFAIFKLNIVYAIGATMLQLSEKYAYTAPEVRDTKHQKMVATTNPSPAILYHCLTIRSHHVRSPVY